MACNHTNINCGCKDSFLTTPAPCPTPVGCPDPQPCSEVFDAQCIVYTGDPIICDQDTVVATNDTVADALNQVVDYFCNQPAPAQCCPTFAVDINRANTEIFRLDSTLTNGTAPFTYQWTIEQNEFQGLAFTGSTTSANVLLEPVPNNYVVAALSALIFQVLVKVKVTDSAGQIATAYYNAVFKTFN